MRRSSIGRNPRLLLGSVVACLLLLTGCGAGATTSPTADLPSTGAPVEGSTPAAHAARDVDALVAGFEQADQHSAHVAMRVLTKAGELEHGTGTYRTTPSGLDMRMSVAIDPTALKRSVHHSGTQQGESPHDDHATVETPETPRHARSPRAFAGGTMPEASGKPERPDARHMQLVVLGDRLYLKVPRGGERTGKHWTAVDAGTRNDTTKVYSAIARTAKNQADPSAVLHRVESAGRIEKATDETLDGRPVTHYTITIDARKAASSIKDPELRAAAATRAERMPPTYSMDTWFSGANLPMKIVIKHRLPDLGPATVELEFSKWGQSVSITAPPADQVGAPPKSG